MVSCIPTGLAELHAPARGKAGPGHLPDMTSTWCQNYSCAQGVPCDGPRDATRCRCLLVQGNTSIFKVAMRLGDTVRVTEKHYAHLAQKDDDIELHVPAAVKKKSVSSSGHRRRVTHPPGGTAGCRHQGGANQREGHAVSVNDRLDPTGELHEVKELGRGHVGPTKIACSCTTGARRPGAVPASIWRSSHFIRRTGLRGPVSTKSAMLGKSQILNP